MNETEMCVSCGLPKTSHVNSWMDGLLEVVLPRRGIVPVWLENIVMNVFERVLEKCGLVWETDVFTKAEVPVRTMCFVDEARKGGLKVVALRTKWGFNNQFRIYIDGKAVSFEGLPTGQDIGEKQDYSIDDKYATKERLKECGFPVLAGESFWFWQKKAAINFARKHFPVVVKPLSGSYSRHVVTNIKSLEDFIDAVRSVNAYSPRFLVEKYFTGGYVHRATVVDNKEVFVVRRLAAHVVGDGISTIEQLIEQKNNHPDRGNADDESYTLFKIIVNEVSVALLKEQGLALNMVPEMGTLVYVQKDPFIRLGADAEEVTDMVHIDNQELFKNIAKAFNLTLVGIDFMCGDISRSWKSQNTAVLELNTLPCIEIHEFPSAGKGKKVGAAILDMIINKQK